MPSGAVANLGVEMDDIWELRRENERLRQYVDELEGKIAFLGQHAKLAKGMVGEKLISKLVDGELTVHTASSDVNLPDGTLIEVKHSKFGASTKGYESGRRWQWQKIFGETGAKTYDYLMLVGDADPAFADKYRDPVSPFVIFCVPFSEVSQLCIKGTKGARGMQLLTNPDRARGTSSALFRDYQVTTAELATRFGRLG